MKGIKKSIGLGISAFLLLCFSVTVLPLDAFHNHSDVQTSCNSNSDNQEACQHDHHISVKNAFCSICAIHFDKSFTGKPVFSILDISPKLPLFFGNDFTSSFLEQIFYSLRAPPLQ